MKDKIYLDDIVALMRKYIEKCRPQSFVSVFPLYVRLCKSCERLGVKRADYEDIEAYAVREKIEQYNFKG